MYVCIHYRYVLSIHVYFTCIYLKSVFLCTYLPASLSAWFSVLSSDCMSLCVDALWTKKFKKSVRLSAKLRSRSVEELVIKFFKARAKELHIAHKIVQRLLQENGLLIKEYFSCHICLLATLPSGENRFLGGMEGCLTSQRESSRK